MHKRRAEVLTVLQRADAALTVRQVADETKLPLNTARFHLDGLVSSGQAIRTHEKRSTPGRPSVLYEAAEKDPGPRSFRLLAEMLTSLVARLDDSTERAEEAGRAWGRHLVERTDPLERVDAQTAITRLNAMLEAVGFAPQMQRVDGRVKLSLHHCPFLEVAQSHRTVVCAMHLGLMEGAVAELGAPLEIEGLVPFATTETCTSTLRATRD